jgi:FAD/FMN-containing dehydrogenase
VLRSPAAAYPRVVHHCPVSATGQAPTPPVHELVPELGAQGVLSDGVDLVRYCEPFRGRAGTTAAVLRPATVAQVRAVVAWARRHRVRLLPQGAVTGLVGASTPPPEAEDEPTVVVSLERLDEQPLVDPVDRTAVVTAGTRLSRLNEVAGAHGLVLPIDLGADPAIGGMVATNTGGARMLRHGDVRRHLLGLRAVVADEDCTVVDDLSTLRKHNVGPSPSHWFVGSGGAFGIITHVALELEQLAASRACAWLIPTSDDAALEVLLHLERHHGGWLEAFEVVSAEALDAALSHGSAAHPFGERAAPALSVLVELAGDHGSAGAGDGDAAQERLLVALQELAEAGWIEDGVVVDPTRAWLPRHAVSEGLRQIGAVLGFDVSVPRPSLPPFLRRAREVVAQVAPDAVVADFGHWGDGGVHCNVVLPGADRVNPELARRLREAVLGLTVHDFGGSFSAEHGIGPTNADWWLATTPDGVQHVTRQLKEVLDPLGVLGHPGLPY